MHRRSEKEGWPQRGDAMQAAALERSLCGKALPFRSCSLKVTVVAASCVTGRSEKSPPDRVLCFPPELQRVPLRSLSSQVREASFVSSPLLLQEGLIFQSPSSTASPWTFQVVKKRRS